VRKMVKLDARYGYLAIYIIMFTLATVPIPSPVPILEWTKALYDYVDALPPRSLIVMSSQYGTPGPTFEPFALAFLHHALIKDLRVVMVGPALAVVHWNDLILRGTGWFDTKEYGVDFVNLGYLAGMEAGIAVFASDPHMVFERDYYGNLIEELPIMQDFRSAEDIAFLQIIFDMLPMPIAWVRQWRPYGVPIGIHHYGGPGGYLPYYYAGDYIGVSSDLGGGAQYEYLVGKPGLALALTTLSSTMHLLQVGVIVVASVAYWYVKLTKREEES